MTVDPQLFNVSVKVADILQKIAATFAFLVGGGWVLMNYIRNRTHVPRLQIEVEAEIIELIQRHYLLATIKVRNLGLSIITLPEPIEEGAVRGAARSWYRRWSMKKTWLIYLIPVGEKSAPSTFWYIINQ